MTLVFGYGSNMDKEQMTVRCPAAEKVGNAVLRNYDLCFPRRSSNRNCGVSSVVAAQGREVWGVVHRLNDDDLRSLDRSEGYRSNRPTAQNSYNRVPIMVEMDGELTEVQIYLAVGTQNPPGPNADYIKHIRDGALQNDLPAAYQERLAELSRDEQLWAVRKTSLSSGA